MNQTDRLKNLLQKIEKEPETTCIKLHSEDPCENCKYDQGNRCNQTARKADYLIKNGVFCPPCKVGDTLYTVYYGMVFEGKVQKIIAYITEKEIVFRISINTEIDNANGQNELLQLDVVLEPYKHMRLAYLTREEAEKDLLEE